MDTTHAATFRFQILGPFTVLRDGLAMPDRDVGSRQGRTLLKMLLLERDRLVPAHHIAEVIWGDDPPARWERDLATLVSRLRGVFGPDAIRGGPSGYRFSPSERFEIDLTEAERLVLESESREPGEPGLALATAERALQVLGRGGLLEDEPYAEWADPARGQADTLVRRARRSAWAGALALTDHGTAARHAEGAIAADPFDEEAYRALMLAHHLAGLSGRALAVYELLRIVLADELGSDPSQETRELHAAILREEPLLAPHSATAVAPPSPSRDQAFVGREGEMEELARHWAEAVRDRSELVLVVGEAGIGKTRLAEQLLRVAESTGGLVLQARCFEAERSLFLQPVADALRSVVVGSRPDAVRNFVGEWAGPLADVIPEVGQILRPLDYRPASPDIERRRIFEAASSVLRALSSDRPTLLFLDDLHHAGASTLEFLHFLRRRIATARLLILCTVRAEEGEEALAHLKEVAFRIDIGPLPLTAVQELADQVGAGDQAGPLMARTRGHTLFVVESLRHIAEAGAGSAGAPSPESLVDAVLTRVGRAGREVEELLRSASILGSTFDLETAAALADLAIGEAARRAERACRARLLVEAGPSFEFGNDLLREILYRTTPLATRTAGHARAADLLGDNPEAVAAHAVAAGHWRRAFEAWLRAAERAAERFSNRDAELMLSRALEAAGNAGDPVGEARARLERGRVRELRADYEGAYEDQWASIERARAAGDRRIEMLALRWLGGDLIVGLGRTNADCVPYLEEALAIADELDDGKAQVDILSRLAILSSNRLRFDLAFEQGLRAEDLARRLGDEEAVAVALDGLKTAAAYSGDISKLERLLPELEGILRRRGEPWQFRLQWTVFESSFAPMARGDWPRALRRIDDAMAMSRQTGLRPYQAPMLAHAGWIHRSQGDYGKALSLGMETIELADETGHPWWTAVTESMLGWTLTELFALDDAKAHLERGLAAAERDGSEGYILRCLGHLALATALGGEDQRALVVVARAEELISSLAVPAGGLYVYGADAILATARARLVLNQPERAEALLGRVREDSEAAGWREPLADALLIGGLCRHVLGDLDEAGRLLARALEDAQDAGLRRIEWETLAALAELSEARGSGEEAAKHAAAARSIVDSLSEPLSEPALRDAYVRRARRPVGRSTPLGEASEP